MSLNKKFQNSSNPLILNILKSYIDANDIKNIKETKNHYFKKYKKINNSNSVNITTKLANNTGSLLLKNMNNNKIRSFLSKFNSIVKDKNELNLNVNPLLFQKSKSSSSYFDHNINRLLKGDIDNNGKETDILLLTNRYNFRKRYLNKNKCKYNNYNFINSNSSNREQYQQIIKNRINSFSPRNKFKVMKIYRELLLPSNSPPISTNTLYSNELIFSNELNQHNNKFNSNRNKLKSYGYNNKNRINDIIDTFEIKKSYENESISINSSKYISPSRMEEYNCFNIKDEDLYQINYNDNCNIKNLIDNFKNNVEQELSPIEKNSKKLENNEYIKIVDNKKNLFNIINDSVENTPLNTNLKNINIYDKEEKNKNNEDKNNSKMKLIEAKNLDKCRVKQKKIMIEFSNKLYYNDDNYKNNYQINYNNIKENDNKKNNSKNKPLINSKNENNNQIVKNNEEQNNGSIDKNLKNKNEKYIKIKNNKNNFLKHKKLKRFLSCENINKIKYLLTSNKNSKLYKPKLLNCEYNTNGVIYKKPKGKIDQFHNHDNLKGNKIDKYITNINNLNLIKKNNTNNNLHKNLSINRVIEYINETDNNHFSNENLKN